MTSNRLSAPGVLRAPVLFVALCWALLFAYGPASALTFIMPTDAELLAGAPIVVAGTITSAVPGRAPGWSHTDYALEVSDVLKGFVAGSTLIVRQPGGMRDDGLVAYLPGVSRFAPGDEVLLFLEPRADGTFALSGLATSSFHLVTSPLGKIAVRRGASANEAARPGDTQAAERARAHLPKLYGAFADWIRRTDRGERPAARYTPASSVVGLAQGFEVTKSPPENPPDGCGAQNGNLAVRWTEMDNAIPVVLKAHVGGSPGVAGGGFTEIQQAIAAWTNDPNSGVLLIYGGTTNERGDLDSVNGQIIVDFEDPRGQIDGSSTLAITAVYIDCDQRHSFGNGSALRLVDAEVITEKGIASSFFSSSLNPSKAAAELFAHEFGHVAGIGHSCGDLLSTCPNAAENQATMRAVVHDDGRGANLFPDDLAAAAFLYPLASGSPPAAPSNLTATPTSTSTIALSWTDNSNDETSFEVEEKVFGGDFALVETLAANTTAIEITNIPEATAATYRVRARSSGGPSAYSNQATAATNATPGTCTEDVTTLCLSNNRFRVTTQWQTTKPEQGEGQAFELTDDTGYFWFFNSTNVEMVLKVLNTCSFANRFWVFAGGLTNVEVEITVVDTQSGNVKAYMNPQSTPFQPIQDTQAFATCP